MIYGYVLDIDAAGLLSNDPTSVVTLEAGGISTIQGVDFLLDYRVVQEPASILRLTGVAMLAMRQRR